MNILDNLEGDFEENSNSARDIVATQFDEGEGARAQIQATLALAAATKMIVEILAGIHDALRSK